MRAIAPLSVIVSILMVLKGSVLAQEVVRIWDTADPRRDVIREQIWREFEEKFGVKVEFEGVPFGQMRERILTAAAGGMLPDVIRFIEAPQFAHLGLLQPMDDYVTERHKEQFFEWVWSESNYYDGKLYGYPYLTYIAAGIFYNKGLFRDSGLAFPEEDWTWDDFAEANRKLQRRDGAGDLIIAGADMWGGAAGLLQSMVWSQGGEVLNKQANRMMLQTDEANRALGILVSLIQEGMQYGRGEAPWLAGETGMVIEHTGFLRQFARQIGAYPDLDYGYVNLPRFLGHERVLPVATADAFMITRTARNPEMAFNLIDTYQQPKWIAALQREVLPGNPTPFRAALSTPPDEHHAFIHEDPDLLKIMQSMATETFREPIQYWHIAGADLTSALNSEIEAAFYGRKSVAEALRDAEQRMNRILERDRHKY